MSRSKYPLAPVRRRRKRVAKKIAKRFGMATYVGAYSTAKLILAQAELAKIFADPRTELNANGDFTEASHQEFETAFEQEANR